MSLGLLALVVVIAFAVGSIPFGLLISRTFYATDLRREGSGNIGAANALRTLGKRGAAAVLVLDMLKGFVPTLGAAYFGGTIAASLAALVAVAGHCWSPWLGGRGGKGVATLFGSVFALWWPAGIAFALVWIAAIAAAGFASVASMIATIAMIPILWLGIGTPGLAYALAAAIVIVVRHGENLDRLRHGTENRFSMLKAKRT